MLKYLSGLFTGVLLGAISYAVLNAYIVSESPEVNRRYSEYIKSCIR